jgi:hypothetical protein
MEFRSLSKKVAARLGVDAPAIADDSGQMRPEAPAAPETDDLRPVDRSRYETVGTATASTTGSR